MPLNIHEAYAGIDAIIENLKATDSEVGEFVEDYRALMVATLLVIVNQRRLTRIERIKLDLAESNSEFEIIVNQKH